MAAAPDQTGRDGTPAPPEQETQTPTTPSYSASNVPLVSKDTKTNKKRFP